MALDMRSSCERCGAALRPGGEAASCSYECPFCLDCSDAVGSGCRNGAAELVSRPRRLAAAAG